MNRAEVGACLRESGGVLPHKAKSQKLTLEGKKPGPLFSAFKYFDPLNTDLREFNLPALHRIAVKAREILKARDRKEIDYALMEVGQIVGAGRDISLKIDRTERLSYVEILRKEIDSYALGNDAEFPNATAPEYFAVLALAIIGQVLLRYPLTPNRADGVPLLGADKLSDPEHRLFIEELTSSAKKAIAFAEARTEQTNKKRAAANTRHALTKELKIIALNIYRDNYADRNISNAQVAKWIWNRIKERNRGPDGKPILRRVDPEKTLERWVAEFKRESQRSNK
jgi:hypothetical protein